MINPMPVRKLIIVGKLKPATGKFGVVTVGTFVGIDVGGM
jgi:hypothetical protein